MRGTPAGTGSVAEQVRAMQAAVETAGAELAAGAQAWEAGNARLEVLLQQQFAAERRTEGDAQQTQQAQARLDAVARRAYTHPLPETWSLVTSVDPRALTRSLETLQVLRRVGATQRGAVEALALQRTGSRDRAARLDALRQQAQAEQLRLDAQLTALQARSAAVLAELEAAQARLERLRAEQRAQAQRAAAAARAAAGRQRLLASAVTTGTCSATADGSYANGFLPPEMLCPLATAPGQQLAAQAAAAFDQLSERHRADLGRPLCVTDSYRDYAGQVAIFAQKPSLAATPGRSQHGWGLAVDLCGGIERFGSTESAWMAANGPAYGFAHPSWAEPGGSRPEPWHWEFSG
ncbi:MAG: M15 family metallopeptidase [Actinobacteria bacterium]|nr:M15 family metallopeptidase [Actinomycetota bacterium]MCA1722482.1 M15 family metallopeptidase [Actinomycetota bacterium]